MAAVSEPTPGVVVPLGRDEAAYLRRLVRVCARSSPELARELLAYVERRTEAASAWRFVMAGPVEEEAVLRWLCDNAIRLRVSIRLWGAFHANLHSGTNQILMDRALMMERAGASSSHVSDALAEFLAIGAVERRREGGAVLWFLSTKLATHLAGAARVEAQRAAPPLLAAVEHGAPAP